MATAGYSGTPLLKKLGITPGMKVQLISEPENYMQLLETDIFQQVVTGRQMPDLIHFFARDNHTFKKRMQNILLTAKKNSSVVIWVSWYKKSSGIATDLNEDAIRNFALQHDLVDVKVCAVSNEWSALKLVMPLAKRK